MADQMDTVDNTDKANKDLGAELFREFDKLVSDRTGFEQQWTEVAELVVPTDSPNAFSSAFTPSTPGQKNSRKIYDTTAANALDKFAAIMDSILTPRNQKWHKLKTNNPDVNKDRDVRLYFEQVNDILFRERYAPKANFASQNQMVFKSVGGYGNGAIFADELEGESGLRYKSMFVGEIYWKENHQGIIDELWRRFFLKPGQAVRMFGEANLPAAIVSAANSNQNTDFCFLHVTRPRKDWDPSRKDMKGKRFSSHYVSEVQKQVLREGGYRTFPYAPARYNQANNEMWGRGPAMTALPAIKTLNEQKKTMLTQGHRAINPVLLMADDGIMDTASVVPGAMIAGGVTADGRPLVHALPTGNIALGKDLMDLEKADIQDPFLVRLFQILTENPQMTATEVLERTKEKGMLLAPTAGRLNDEYLGPLIERELDILVSQGKLPPMPQLLIEAGGEYQLVHDSPLMRAMRADEASGFMHSVQTSIEIVNATGDPSHLDHYDFDTAIPELADINGAPVRWLKDAKALQDLRVNRAKMQAEQQQINAAPNAAALIKAKAVAGKAGGQPPPQGQQG